ncbi:MAG: 2-succinyl-5-enolpyruvyl-6-hydroxy-3-cyclohexene-1-carboxylate synthase, partial [Actinomycetota bacterium]|nr:2-succinyl-5-enolpyruvyl-6-hydroxy-3-cyclohexene-1-carboxylate synthase [Actinomycetota bacterium]
GLVEELAGHGGRGVIVAGAGAGEPAAVHALAAALGWPVLADPRSGCRLPVPTTVAAADALLRVGRFAREARPDLVLRLGAPWASRLVGDWLAHLDACQYLVDPHGAWFDPSRTAAAVVTADPTMLARAVAGAPGLRPAPEAWTTWWREAEAAAQAAIDTELAELAQMGEINEPGVARGLVDVLPDGATLVVSSSMPVRDVEWFGRPRRGLRVLSNRGANGIDGVVSTAFGVAAAASGPTCALVGDLAFLHDATGLRAARASDGTVKCTVVVVDNAGGGIFSFLPQAGELPSAAFERLLATPHDLDLVAVARGLGAPAEEVFSVKELVSAIETTNSDGTGARVIVVRTDRAANVAVHERLHRAVATAMGA